MPITRKTITHEQYVTSDDKAFNDYEEAEKHEFRLQIEKIVAGFYYRSMSESEVADAIIVNFEAICFLQ